jgi:putative ABC transport system permease protein
LGFDKEQVLSVPLKPQVRERIEAIKNELLKNSSVLGISASSFTPNSEIWHEGFSWENGEKDMMIDRISADADFFKLFNVQLLDGRAFSKEFINDPTQAYILNEAAVKFIGWNSALGQEVAWNGRKGTVVGVAKDFHYKPLRDAIQPLLITNRAFGFSYLCIKIQPDDIPATVDFLRQTWSGIVPDYPFEYHFFDQDFDRVYKSEERMGAAFSYFSGLAIFIACLGLLGLSWFAINQRTKEIGIRKVLGATLTDIVYLISRDFVKLVIIASLIGLPVAYWAMNQWLNNFAYRIEPGWGMFGLSLAIGLLTALLTVASQSVRAALADPVETLRYE